MKFLTTAALALGMSLSLASAEEVCVCSSVCKMYGDPHVKSMWMDRGNYIYHSHDPNVVLFADSQHGFKVTGFVDKGKTTAKVKSPFLQRVKVGSKTYYAEKCTEGKKWFTSHGLNDDTTLKVMVECKYPKGNTLDHILHLDVKVTLIQNNCESKEDFKNWAISHTSGVCTTPKSHNNGNGKITCLNEEPTPRPTKRPSRKPHKPTSAPTPTLAPSPTPKPSKTSSPTPPTQAPSPTPKPSKTSSPTGKTSAPTGSSDDRIVTGSPTMPVTPSGGNMTCTIKGDPHAKCFANDDEFQFYPQEENKYVMLYEMPGKLEAIGHVRSFVSSSTNEATDIVDKLLIKYNGKWQLEVGYENQCNAALPGAIQNGSTNDQASTSMAPSHNEYEWGEEGLIISWKCAVDQDGSPQGMMVVFNKQVSAPDQYKYEQEHNGGICSACNAAQPYTGKLPGQE